MTSREGIIYPGHRTIDQLIFAAPPRPRGKEGGDELMHAYQCQGG
jgi:hypothetical protein